MDLIAPRSRCLVDAKPIAILTAYRTRAMSSRLPRDDDTSPVDERFLTNARRSLLRHSLNLMVRSLDKQNMVNASEAFEHQSWQNPGRFETSSGLGAEHAAIVHRIPFR
jgi:hypothetical protein